MKKELSPKQLEELLVTLKTRFEKNMNRYQGLEWSKIQMKLEANPEKLWSLSEMEKTEGEPDVVGFDQKAGEYIFYVALPRQTLQSLSASCQLRLAPLALRKKKDAACA